MGDRREFGAGRNTGNLSEYIFAVALRFSETVKNKKSAIYPMSVLDMALFIKFKIYCFQRIESSIENF